MSLNVCNCVMLTCVLSWTQSSDIIMMSHWRGGNSQARCIVCERLRLRLRLVIRGLSEDVNVYVILKGCWSCAACCSDVDRRLPASRQTCDQQLTGCHWSSARERDRVGERERERTVLSTESFFCWLVSRLPFFEDYSLHSFTDVLSSTIDNSISGCVCVC